MPRINYPPSWPQEARDALDALFAEARQTGKWFWCHYQDLWFSPDDLEAKQKAGSFIWGAVNWKLRNPKEQLAEAVNRARSALAEVDRIATQISANQ